MHNEDRGKIRNKDQARQLKAFAGLRYGKITPTDIDGFLDFGNEMFIFFELKHKGAPLQRGQQLALERLCDACESKDRESCLIIASHDTPVNEEIDAASAIVTQVRYRRKWSSWIGRNITVKECIDRFRKKDK